jgi:acetyl esterase
MALDAGKVVLDPQAKAILDLIALAGRIPYSQITPALARAQFVELCRRTRKNDVWPVWTRDHELPGASGQLRSRMFVPEKGETAEHPALVFFHGGGWCIGDLDTHDPVCRQLASEVPCAICSIEYRLAPEHPFPAAVEDCFAALRFLAFEGHRLGLDTARLAVGGDSAGGNLAAVSAILARDAGLKIGGQLLIYPATDWITPYPSREHYGDGFLLTQEAIRWFGGNYIELSQHQDWRASPLFAPNLSHLPPALIICGECDPLRDESRAYGTKLSEAGNDASFVLYPGMIHGFWTMGGVVAAADHAMATSAQFLRRVFKR